MNEIIQKPDRLEGILGLPGDKSVSHRALLLNAIGTGKAVISGLAGGADVQSTIRCLKQLGVTLRGGDNCEPVEITGSGGTFTESKDVLNVANSGTTIRLLAGILAAQPFFSILTGDDSLRLRPMGRIIEPLKLMGADVRGRRNDQLAPMSMRGGNLRGVEYTLPVPSAQVKSCIILAALGACDKTVIQQVSHSRDHTERMLETMGVSIEKRDLTLVVHPGTPTATDIDVPGDISSAAYWLVAAICHPNARVTLPGVGINFGRTGFLDVLQSMGAKIRLENRRFQGGEPVADITAESSSLVSVELEEGLMPRILDEVPVLAVAACFAQGQTIIRDALELRVKESDRIRTTVLELARLGASIEELPDGMIIKGAGALRGGSVDTHGDHRLAMALAVAGILADGKTTIVGSEVADVSYPSFWDHLRLMCKD